MDQDYKTVCYVVVSRSNPGLDCTRCYYIDPRDGSLLTPDPVNRSCFGSGPSSGVAIGAEPGVGWGSRYSDPDSAPDAFPPSDRSGGAGNENGSSYTEAGLGAMAGVLSRIFNDGAYNRANQEVAEHIDELKQTILNRASSLDSEYTNLVLQSANNQKAATTELSRFLSELSADQKKAQVRKMQHEEHWRSLLQQANGSSSDFGNEEGRLILDFLKTSGIEAQVEASLPLSNLRQSGFSIASSLDGLRTRTYGGTDDLHRAIRYELLKQDEAFQGGPGASDAMRLVARNDLLYASHFADTGSAEGQVLGKGLVMEAQAVRFHSLHLIKGVYTSTVNNDGEVNLQKWDGTTLPSSAIRKRVETFEESWRSSEILRNMVARQLQAHPRPGYEGVRASRLVIVTGLLLHEATDQFYKGNLLLGNAILGDVRAFLELATFVNAPLAFSRALYQCISGEDYLTGGRLSPTERGINGWLAILYGAKPVAVALKLGVGIFPAAGVELDEVLADEVAFDRWLGRRFPADRPYADAAAQKIWDKLKARGLNPELDPGHGSSKYRATPHIHVPGKNVHIPVSKTFRPK